MKTIPSNIRNKNILFATLDWGMGHLTRSTVLMKELIGQGNKISFAGTISQCDFIQNEFNEITCHELNGYEIRLDSNKNTFYQLAKQYPKIKKAIQFEQNWLKSYVQQNEVDLIISDNRYGFYHHSIESVLLTHQLNLQLPKFSSIINKKLHQWISKFNSVWVPDYEDRRLTEELSNPEKQDKIHFIGPLCRFEFIDLPLKYDNLIILSGPEPERSIFLKSAIKYSDRNEGTTCIVGATIGKGICASYPNPTTKELNELIAQSETVISRAGYTTIMEMVVLNKNAILIPTTGQYEQEYLARTVKHPCIVFQESLLLD